MPELVACPVCGCKAQVPEALPGRRVRCFGCNQYFTPSAAPAPPPAPEPAPPPPQRPPPVRLDEEDAPSGPATPLCPGCERPAPWELERCRYCGLEFEPDDPRRPGPRRGLPFRRDLLPHRGELIALLGQISLVCGGLAVCGGVSAAVGVPLGALAYALAQIDLERMRAGLIDPAGRMKTEAGRGAALAGLLLGLLFAAGWALLWLARIR